MIQLPKLSKLPKVSANSDMVSQYLVTGLLMAASFLIGMLLTEVRYLKAGGNADKAPVAQIPAAGNNLPGNGAPADGGAQAKQVPKVTASDKVRGAKNPQVWLIEYSDLECPFCKRFHPTMQQIMDKYGDKVAWVYRHYPLSIHPNAQKAAETTECVYKLAGNDKTWKFIDLYTERTSANGTGIALDKMADLAVEAAGVNKAAVQKCLDSGEMAKQVSDAMAGGGTAGVAGTPGTILLTKNGDARLISGAVPFEEVSKIVESYLNK